MAHRFSPSGATLKGEAVVAVGPVMRTANILWDADAEEPSAGDPPAALAQNNAQVDHSSPSFSSTATSTAAQTGAATAAGNGRKDASAKDAEQHVQIVIVKANAENEAPATQRPPPLDARQTYPSAPLLRPVAATAFPEAAPAWHASSLTPLSSSSGGGGGTSENRESFTADEVVDVGYKSGAAVRTSVIADALRFHFLSGHNAMCVVAGTPRCAALTEDAVATTVQRVYEQSAAMGSGFVNELSLTAHSLFADGTQTNLLPTTSATTTSATTAAKTSSGDAVQYRTEIRIGTNPVMGTCVVNDPPVQMQSSEDAAYLSRALVQNARQLRSDPFSDPNALVHVTLLLRQVRATQHPMSTLELPLSTPHSARVTSHTTGSDAGRTKDAASNNTHAESAASRHVYLSSLHVLFVGHNYHLLQRLLTHQPAHVFPLYRQAFGGHCCSAVLSFVDRRDDLTYSKTTLEFSQYMRGFVNQPPRSGSVQRFLDATALAAKAELDRDIVSLDKMRRDAMLLLADPKTVEPCFYAVTPCTEVPQKPYLNARRVVLLPPTATMTSVEAAATAAGGGAVRGSRQIVNERNRGGAAWEKGGSSSGGAQLPSAVSSSYSGKEIQIQMPSFVRRRERPTRAPPSATQTTTNATNAVDAPTVPTVPPPPPPVVPHTQQQQQQQQHSSLSTDQGSLNTFSVHSKDAQIRSDRHRRRSPVADITSSSSALQHTTGLNGSEGPLSTTSGYGESVKTNVFVLPGGVMGDHKTNSSNGNALLPLCVVDNRTLVLKGSAATPAVADASFEVDEVQEGDYDASSRGYALLNSFSALQGIYTTFVENESNVALLCTHCGGGDHRGSNTPLRSFQRLPVWEVLESIMTAVSQAQMKQESPSQFTMFGSLLRGTTIVCDLAEVGSPPEDRRVDGEEALVGASPLFGAILFETRGVDLFDVAEVQPVLHSMLQYADDAAADDPEVYIVMTAVRKTTRALDPQDAPDHIPEYQYDANFSSCTVVVTRNTTAMFENALAELNAVVEPQQPVYPFGLLSEAVGGACQTVHLVTLETAQTSHAVVSQVLRTQQTLAQVQNEALRSSSVSSYVQSCLGTARTIYLALESAKQQREQQREEQAPVVTPEEEQQLLLHAARLEALAEQHVEYLITAHTTGFVIYQAHTIEDLQTLFFTSFRYSNASSGRLRKLRAGSCGALTLESPLNGKQNHQQQQQQSAHPLASSLASVEAVVDISDDLPASAKNRDGAVVNAAARQPVSAAALTRDAGIIAHTMLLLLSEEGTARSPERRSTADAGGARGTSTCKVTTSATNEVTVNYGAMESVYAFDDILRLTRDDTPSSKTRVSPTHNFATFSASPLLHDAVAGCLAGYNAAMVFQETLPAQESGVAEALVQHVCRNAMSSCPPEAAFFLSAAYLDEESALDLLDRSAVRSAVHQQEEGAQNRSNGGHARGVRGGSPLLLGKSPLTGVCVANAALTPVHSSRDVAEALAMAFHHDKALSAAGAPPHLLAVSLWQKLYVSAEQDVCVSSLLLLLTRGGPQVLQAAVARPAGDATAQLLMYALRGACYTICGCAITDTEPQVHSPNAASTFGTAMDFYQNNLNAYTGKQLRYNSVADALKSHRNELARVQARVDALKARTRAGGGADAATPQEKRDADAAEFAMQHLRRMIYDEETLLLEKTDALTTVPPFYVAGVHH